MRSFDPDVDADKHSQYSTTNEVIAQKTQGYALVEYVQLTITGAICLSSNDHGSVAATMDFQIGMLFQIISKQYSNVGTTVTSDSAISLVVYVQNTLEVNECKDIQFSYLLGSSESSISDEQTTTQKQQQLNYN